MPTVRPLSETPQGIKFYDPKVVGDTPEAVELGGMRNLLKAVRDQVGCEAGYPILESDTRLGMDRWGQLDDVVMGGASQSGLTMVQGKGEDGGPCAVYR